MRLEIITGADLDASLVARWRQLQSNDPDLKSPFFTPDFCRLVSDVRDDLRIAVIQDGGEIRGFFPFHQQRFGRIAPLAGQISDYHGIIGDSSVIGDGAALLHGIGARAYDFNHAPRSQNIFAAQAYRMTESPIVDLKAGFEDWRATQRAEVRAIKDVERRGRKLAREVGPLRFVPNDVSDDVWAQFLDWKRAALAAMGVRFILDMPWAGAIAEAVRHADTPDFGGMTSALWAGDTLVAVHFGMRSRQTWHWWFPCYNETHSRYSPGLALLMECLEHTDGTEIVELDFGRGSDRYKREFANAARPLCEGSFEKPFSLAGAPRRLRKAAQRSLTRSGADKAADLSRRIGDRLLGAGRLF